MGILGIGGKGGLGGFLGKALDFISKPLEAITSPIKGLVGGLLDKLPGGIGEFLKPIANTLIDNAAGFLAGGPLGALGSLGQAAKTFGDVAKIAETFKGAGDAVGALTSKPAQDNFQNILAFAQAALIK